MPDVNAADPMAALREFFDHSNLPVSQSFRGQSVSDPDLN
jgi:hypothetical protein